MKLVPWKHEESLWNPFYGLEDVQDQINRLFNLSLGGRTGKGFFNPWEGTWNPAVDIYDSDDNLVIRADIPGMDKDDIHISVHSNILTIEGGKEKETKTRNKGCVRKERVYGSFKRVITLPGEVDPSRAKASYKKGVLELTLPKREEAKPKQIKIDG